MFSSKDGKLCYKFLPECWNDCIQSFTYGLEKWSFPSLKKKIKNKKIEEGKKKKVAAACQQYLTKYKEQNFHKFYIGEKWYLFSLKIERIQKSEFKASTNGIWYLPIRQTCKKETNVAMTSNKMFQVVWWSKILGFSSKELLRKKNILNFLLSTTSTWHFPQIKKKKKISFLESVLKISNEIKFFLSLLYYKVLWSHYWYGCVAIHKLL